ncbi:anthrone oxygenase family protein [Inquilinus sp. OTU3971]|uniref:anthrone oxygenase family protein n=1 Tax=Inquilinus sp. OTU3971 TaxID=3043855 RepID=UPI00313BFE77
MIGVRSAERSATDGSAAGVRAGAGVWLVFAATLLAGTMAGFFWSFSIVVMPGLAALDPLDAMAAMQAINAAVRNAVFGLVFAGAIVSCLAVLVLAAIHRRGAWSWLALAGAAVYVAGAAGTTVGFNVPLNRMLEPLDPRLAENAPVMLGYLEDWTRWNHVRTLASLAAFILFSAALVAAATGRGGRASGR